MCGRFSLVTSKEKIKEQFGIQTDDNLQLSFNIAPTQKAYIIANDLPDQLQLVTWGLVPYWSNDGQNAGTLINARAEGISTKPSFRMPMRKRRCLVLADSFYEWRREGQTKMPYRIMFPDNQLLAMAGIWDNWEGDNVNLKTFSIITTTPNKEMADLHNRMPVILTEDQQKRWLENISLDDALDMLQPLPDNQLQIYRISNKLNSPVNNSDDLHKKVAEPPTLF